MPAPHAAPVPFVRREYRSVPAKTDMLYRKMGNAGLRLSALSFGTWTTFSDQLDDDAAFQLIETAMQHGCNTFDASFFVLLFFFCFLFFLFVFFLIFFFFFFF